MPKVNVFNQNGDMVGDIELNKDIFDIEVNEHVVYEVVKNQLANRRQGTQSAKTRAEVRGGGKKPWRQKGTGRTRQGSIRSSQWKGGGVVFAPKPRDYSYKVPKKVKRLAMKSVLTSKVKDEEIIVLDNLVLEIISTKEAVKILKNIKADKKALVVIAESDEKVYRSFRNIENVDTVTVKDMNVYDILRFNSFIITKDAIAKVEEVLA